MNHTRRLTANLLLPICLMVLSAQNSAWAVDVQRLNDPSVPMGWDVAADSGTVLVGARYFDNPGLTWTREGAAFLYNAQTGENVGTLLSSVPFSDEGFGTAVGLSGKRAIVGAPNANSGIFADHTGAAYLLEGTTGFSTRRLLALDGERNGHFGEAVAIGGRWALVGAPAQRDLNGDAYLFDAETGQQLAKFSIATGVGREWFGRAMDLDGDVAVIGAPGGFTTSQGDAYLYDLQTRSQRTRLIAPDLVPGSHFGMDVAISGDLALVGAIESLDGTGPGTGAAYLFDTRDGHFIRKLAPSRAARRRVRDFRRTRWTSGIGQLAH